jgi:hypothetical protein
MFYTRNSLIIPNNKHMEVPVNYAAVLVAAIANMILGSLWFGPLFGKAWMAAGGWTKEIMTETKKKGMTMSYVLMGLGSFVMACTLAHVLVLTNVYFGTSGVSLGVSVGFLSWVGFVAPVTMGVVLWENKSWTYWMITHTYYLVALVLMGAILAVW